MLHTQRGCLSSRYNSGLDEP